MDIDETDIEMTTLTQGLSMLNCSLARAKLVKHSIAKYRTVNLVRLAKAFGTY